MMKASVGLDNLRIMLPMISYVKELDEALSLLRRAHAELIEEGIDVAFPQIGSWLKCQPRYTLSVS